jgi:hypothetical protein
MPILQPRAGFLDPNDTKSLKSVWVTSVFFVLASLVFTVRIYTRLRPVFQPSWDDLFICISYICVTVTFVTMMKAAIMTGDRHITFVVPSKFDGAFKLCFISLIFSIWSNVFIKISIAFMLLRIRHTSGWRLGLGTMIVACLLVGFIATLLEFVQCKPISASWTA